jgi:flagellar basal body-associated protein FliL
MTDQDMGDYKPVSMDEMDPELKRKKKRRKIIIIILIVLGVLLAIAGIVILILLLFTQALATVCTNACGAACEQSCNNACNDNIASANVGDSSLEARTYIIYAWETMRDWFFDFFN